MRFSEELKRLREAKGISQSALARSAGYDHSYVSRLESAGADRRQPSRDAVERLSRAVGASWTEKRLLAHAAGFATPTEVERYPVLSRLAALLDSGEVDTLEATLEAVAAMACTVRQPYTIPGGPNGRPQG